MPRRGKTPEGYVSSALRDLFLVERIYAMRVNSGTLLLDNRDGSKRAVRLAKKGTADWLAFIPFGNGSFLPLWAETKAPLKGLSSDQEEFRDDVESRGHAYLIVHDIDIVVDWLREFRKRLS